MYTLWWSTLVVRSIKILLNWDGVNVAADGVIVTYLFEMLLDP